MNNANQDKYVWYACYGSNLAEDRFKCYLQGGTYPGNQKQYAGAAYKAPPTHSQQYQINHALYFSKEAPIWGGGGVCFIKTKAQKSSHTLARIYRITRGQFADLHAQECNKTQAASIDYAQLIKQGYLDTFKDKWYGRILYLESREGEPVLTFTHVENLEKYNAPAPAYLQSLIAGLRQCHSLSDKALCQYLLQQEGIKPAYSLADLQALL
jgi:hypothetical protein